MRARAVTGFVFIMMLIAAACGDARGNPSPTDAVEPTPRSISTLALPVTTATEGLTYEGDLRVGVWARVEGTGDCLNFRFSDSTGARNPINYCRPDGYEVYVVGAPRFNGDQWSWEIAGHGWAADDFLAFDREEDLETRVISGFAGLGKIAYIGPQGDLWVMHADGSNREKIVDIDPGVGPRYSPQIGNPKWSPDGTEILVTFSMADEIGNWSTDLRVISLRGSTINEISSAASGSWSPDGGHVAFLHDFSDAGAGVVHATPAVYDLTTGVTTEIGPEGFYLEGPKWRSNDQLLYQGEEGAHLVTADGVEVQMLDAVGMPANWSPDGTRLSFLSHALDCDGYVVYDVRMKSIELCALQPALDTNRGGRGGTAEDGQTDWSPDGRYFAYHTEWAVVDRSGVYVVDVHTGEQTLLQGWKPLLVSFAKDSRHLVFQTWHLGEPFIWVGDAENGDVTLLGEGSQPAWQP